MAPPQSWPSPPPAVLREERTVTLLQASLERIAPAAMEILIEKIEGFGGQLVEVASSGFLAAFGVPPVEDAPSRAARAALAVRNALAQGVRDRASWPTAPRRRRDRAPCGRCPHRESSRRIEPAPDHPVP